MATKQLTEEELMSAPIYTLDRTQIEQRTAIMKLRREEMEYDLAKTAVEKHKDEVAERKRKMEHRIADIQAERDRIEGEQRACQHKTGGTGIAGILNGTGEIYGSSTIGLVLPTGELYFMCGRCALEVHGPDCVCEGKPSYRPKRQVIEGKMSLAEYRRREAQYIEWSRLRRVSYEGINGEWCQASLFTIPKLIKQRMQDNEDFEAWLRTHDEEAIRTA